MWTVEQARDEAKELKRKIAVGKDPMGEVHTERGAPTVADLCERFIKEHLPRKRPKTAADYKGAIEKYIKPAMGSLKVSEVEFSDCDGLHRKTTDKPTPRTAPTGCCRCFQQNVHAGNQVANENRQPSTGRREKS